MEAYFTDKIAHASLLLPKQKFREDYQIFLLQQLSRAGYFLITLPAFNIQYLNNIILHDLFHNVLLQVISWKFTVSVRRKSVDSSAVLAST